MSSRRMRDPVNQPNVELSEARGAIPLGLLKSREWVSDPRRFLFSQARYKFVAKMLSGRRHVLEIGCGDGWNAPIVLQEVGSLTITDFDPAFIQDARAHMLPEYPYTSLVHDFIEGPLEGDFDAAYMLDVLEHVPAEHEARLLGNVLRSLTDDAALIVGMPSLESQVHASPGSKAGHVNCKSAPDLKRVMEGFFRSVFMFSMNDEVVHTGYHKMAHYLLALCAQPRR